MCAACKLIKLLISKEKASEINSKLLVLYLYSIIKLIKGRVTDVIINH